MASHQDQEEFTPILPNISDASMKGAVNTSQSTNEQPSPEDPTKKKSNDNSSKVRTVIIVILVSVIILLLILLVYQIYKYFSVEPLSDTNVKNANVKNANVKNANVKNTNVKNTNVKNANVKNRQPSVSPVKEVKFSTLPRHIKDLDNDVLNQFIKKNNKRVSISHAPPDVRTINNREVMENNKVQNRKTDIVDEKEINRMSQIIDDLQNTDVGVPSREDMVAEMKKDMDGNSRIVAEPEETDNILNTFDDLDAEIQIEEIYTCDFVLTRGKK